MGSELIMDVVQKSRFARTPRYKHEIHKILQMRQVGLGAYLGSSDDIIAKLYSKMDNYELEGNTNPGKKHGGIFNLEFNKDGRLLLAACEKNCVLMYDASNQKLLQVLQNAHNNCVNCVRFLSDHQFATCSDDNTIKLWDTRSLKVQARTLHGHSNWVKNIEYSESENLMVTSAFDGGIYAWDLKSPTESSMIYDKVFLMNGLMRTKLSPDGTKMVISTTSGYIIIVHDLNLSTLASDFRSFRPVIYRLMQTSGQCLPAGSVFNYLFSPTRPRNRVEFIDDFSIDAEVISSLQIHPYSWNCVSRSLSVSETEEVTSVHDIQKRETCQYEICENYVDESEEAASHNSDSDEGGGGGGGGSSNRRPTDLWMGYTANFQYSANLSSPSLAENLVPTMGIINSGLIGRNTLSEFFNQHPDEIRKVVINMKRLTHYSQEKNLGRGYIKELCYSSDGRIICSPYGFGVRLLGFSDNYEELTYCVPEQPQELKTLVKLENYHKEIVVSCKFSPRNMMLVSGCLNGDIVWYKPVL